MLDNLCAQHNVKYLIREGQPSDICDHIQATDGTRNDGKVYGQISRTLAPGGTIAARLATHWSRPY